MSAKKVIHRLGEQDDGILLEYYTFALMAHPRFQSLLVSGSASGKVVIWDVAEGQPMLKFIETGIYSYEPLLMNDIFDGRFSPDGHTFVVGTVLGALSVYSTRSKEGYAMTHTEQFFLAEGLTPDQILENPASKVRLCNHQLAQYDPQPPLTLVKGLSRATELGLAEKMEKFEIQIHEQQKDAAFLKKLEAGQDEEASEVPLEDVIHEILDEDVLSFFQAEKDSESIHQQDIQTEHDHVLFEFYRRQKEIENQPDVDARLKEQVEKENQYYQQQARVIALELNLDEGAFSRVLEEHTFEETVRGPDSPTQTQHRHAATPMRTQVQSMPARQQRQRVSQQRNVTRQQRGGPSHTADSDSVTNERERRYLRRGGNTNREGGVQMMLPTAWNQSGVQPAQRQRQAQNTIEDSDDEVKKLEPDGLSSEEEPELEPRRVRLSRRQRRAPSDDGDYYGELGQEIEDSSSEEMGSDQDYQAIVPSKTRRSNRIAKRRYESSESQFQEEIVIAKRQKSRFSSRTRSSVQEREKQLREHQKKQAKNEPYILYFMERRPAELSHCSFCERALGHGSTYQGPFKREDSRSEIEDSHLCLQDLPSKVFLHLGCLKANDIVFEYEIRKDPVRNMWVGIGQFFLCKLSNQDTRECVRCQEPNFTVSCHDCRDVYHGHICSQTKGVLIDVECEIRFKCFGCRWKQLSNFEENQKDLRLLETVDRSTLYKFSPRSITLQHLRLNQTHQKDIPKVIKSFIDMSQAEFREEVLDNSETSIYGEQELSSLSHAYSLIKDYVPQIGDEMVFIPQLYEEILGKNWMLIEALKQEEDMVVTSLKDMITESDKLNQGGMLIKIKQMQYRFPDLRTLVISERDKLEKPGIVLKLTLQILNMASASSNQQENKQDAPPRQLQIYLTPKNFNCLIHPKHYESATRGFDKYQFDQIVQHFSQKKFKLRLGGQVEISSVCTYDLAMMPYSYFKCLAGKFIDENGKENPKVQLLLSPWELEIESPTNNTEERIDYSLRQRLVKGLYEMLYSRRKDFYWFFNFVKKDVAPNYKSIIPVEVNTNLILKRIVFDYYRSIEALKFDINQMQSNAFEYNQGNENQVRQLAYNCTQLMLMVVEEVLKASQDSEPGAIKLQKSENKYISEAESPYSEDVSSIVQEEEQKEPSRVTRAQTKIKITNDSHPKFITPSMTRRSSLEPSISKQKKVEGDNIIKISMQEGSSQTQRNKRNISSNGVEIVYEDDEPILILIDKQKLDDKRILRPRTRSKNRRL